MPFVLSGPGLEELEESPPWPARISAEELVPSGPSLQRPPAELMVSMATLRPGESIALFLRRGEAWAWLPEMLMSLPVGASVRGPSAD